MRTVLAIAAAVLLIALMAAVIVAHEFARPFITIRRQLAAEDDEGD